MEDSAPRPSQKNSGNTRSPFAESTRVPARARGARLYRVRRLDGGFQWDAEVILNGSLVQRRFENELRARAWLVAATQPLSAQESFDWEELNGRFRAACLAEGA